ncbi:MAG: response regulator [Elusimicrobiota bacterium]|nr:MAG: response regulator [Elusimicrobiota bacterium]
MFDLLLAAEGPRDPKRTPLPREDRRARGAAAARCVLIIDDSEEDYTLLRAAFAVNGFDNLRWARDAAQARDYFMGRPPFSDRAANPVPDVVLLDIQLTTADGFSVLTWLREQAPAVRRVPVVMLTTSTDPSERARAYDMGANSFLSKPTGFDELSATVGDLIGYWLKRNRPA